MSNLVNMVELIESYGQGTGCVERITPKRGHGRRRWEDRKLMVISGWPYALVNDLQGRRWNQGGDPADLKKNLLREFFGCMEP